MKTDRKQWTIQTAGLSDRGLRRSHNEDSLSVVPSLGLFVVADGMGGHNAGEVASRQAIESMVTFIHSAGSGDGQNWPVQPDPKLSTHENRLVAAIKLANRDVCRLSMEYPEYQGMGTTLVALLADPEHSTAAIAHVGDSRCYRVRDGKLEKLTYDHSWVEEQLQRGIITAQEARGHRWKNVITRALGNKLDVEVDVQSATIAEQDLFLLCSDGLSGMVAADELEQLAREEPDLEELARKMIIAANNAGGQDNISLILIRFLKSE